MAARLQAGDALILVDVQLDFLPGGSLAVSHGDEVVPALNLRARFGFEKAEFFELENVSERAVPTVAF